MNPTKEWAMVQELAEVITELETDEQETFITDLHYHLDPFLPFLEQQSPEQEKWLYSLYEKYVNGDDDAAEDVYA